MTKSLFCSNRLFTKYAENMYQVILEQKGKWLYEIYKKNNRK